MPPCSGNMRSVNAMSVDQTLSTRTYTHAPPGRSWRTTCRTPCTHCCPGPSGSSRCSHVGRDGENVRECGRGNCSSGTAYNGRTCRTTRTRPGTRRAVKTRARGLKRELAIRGALKGRELATVGRARCATRTGSGQVITGVTGWRGRHTGGQRHKNDQERNDGSHRW